MGNSRTDRTKLVANQVSGLIVDDNEVPRRLVGIHHIGRHGSRLRGFILLVVFSLLPRIHKR
jgi:hypothetical protein